MLTLNKLEREVRKLEARVCCLERRIDEIGDGEGGGEEETFYIVDESGNRLIDNNGDRLIYQ